MGSASVGHDGITLPDFVFAGFDLEKLESVELAVEPGDQSRDDALLR